MADLSPQAQAVLDAVKEISPAPADEIAAVALRAVAMEVVLNKYQYADWQMADIIMKEIQAIADELEGANG
jgi:menaquinone-dependent protoporphyrinogen IX oxidase